MDLESSSFPWDRLPANLQETILSLLPISTLIRCTAASRSLRRLIQSPSFLSSYPNPSPNPHFLFSRSGSPVAPAYDPLLDRWTSLPIPSNGATSVYLSDGPLLLQLSSSTDLVLSQPFSHRSNIHSVPNPLALLPLALIADGSADHFKIVALSKEEPIRWLVYDSRSGEWESNRQFSGSLPMRTAVANGILYCLICGEDRLFKFDPAVAGGSELELGRVNLPTSVLGRTRDDGWDWDMGDGLGENAVESSLCHAGGGVFKVSRARPPSLAHL